MIKVQKPVSDKREAAILKKEKRKLLRYFYISEQVVQASKNDIYRRRK